MFRVRFALLSTLFAAACGGTPAAVEECPVGTVRVGTQCTPGCTKHDDCLPHELCDPQTRICRAGARPDSGLSGDARPDDATASPDAVSDAGVAGDAIVGMDAGEGVDTGGRDATPGPDRVPVDSGVDQVDVSDTVVDFGRQVIGNTAMRQVRLHNNTRTAINVSFGAIGGRDAASFTVMPVGGSVRLDPGAGADLTFGYRAMGTPGAVRASYTINLCDAGCETTIELNAEAILDPIDCTPTTLDFGLVNAGACVTLPVICRNISSANASILNAVIMGMASRFTARPPGAFPLNLTPGQSSEIAVAYCPSAGVAMDNDSLVVTVMHPVPARNQLNLRLSGRSGGQDIACIPTDISFGRTGVGVDVERIVACQNRGNTALTISAATLSGPQAAEFSVQARLRGMNTNLPVNLGQGEVLNLRIGHSAANPGIRMGVLEIANTDRDTPRVTIPLASEAINTTGCRMAFPASNLDFGAVRIGTTSAIEIGARNIGTGPCAVTIIGLASALTPGAMTPFRVETSANVATVPAGMEIRGTVYFSPTSAMSAMDTLAIQISDPMDAIQTISLAGVGYAGPIVVSPGFIDFGQVPTGCQSEHERVVRIENTSDRDRVTVQSIAIDPGSSNAFRVYGSTVAVTILPHEHEELVVAYAPTAAGFDIGRLRIRLSTGDVFFVVLAAEAGRSGTNTRTIRPFAPRKVDVLFVVDDSGSMAEEQARLAEAMDELIERADAARADYHLGVTTTNGGTGAGRLLGTPAWVDRAQDRRYELMRAAARAGTNGPATEQGLLAARTAVTDPALLMGPNAGFLRPDANLHVIFVTDADDDSPGLVDPYLMAIRGRPMSNGSLTVHAIAGGSTGCTSAGTAAEASRDYDLAVSRTMGTAHSICEQEYHDAMHKLGELIFGPGANVIQLGSRPAPASIEVRVDGQLVPIRTGTDLNYAIDYYRAQILFAPWETPVATSTIAVRYDAFCVVPSCGNNALDAGEQCDDGNTDNTDDCTDTCYRSFCGDGYVRANLEQCDDQNTIPFDGCDDQCVLEGCGNGIVEPPDEQCDDGTRNSDTMANACRTDCRQAHCGDGVRDMGEACDDGNASTIDACLPGCVAARCGDGHLQLGVEGCDDGNTIDTDNCNNMCRWRVAATVAAIARNRPLTPADGQMAINWVGGGNNSVVQIPIGFDFSFVGTTVRDVYLSSNGWLSFQSNTNSAPGNSRIPNPSAPNAIIAWWWDDLDFEQTAVRETTEARTRIDGTAPNRVRTLSFVNVAQFGPGVSYYLLTAEVRLFEGRNTIEVHYGTIQQIGATPNDFSATVGWEGPNGVIGQNILGCGSTCVAADWPSNTVITYSPSP